MTQLHNAEKGYYTFLPEKHARTGEAGKSGAVPSLAEALMDNGAEAVLGWGRPVLDKEASRAAAHLYGELSRGHEPALAQLEESLEILKRLKSPDAATVEGILEEVRSMALS